MTSTELTGQVMLRPSTQEDIALRVRWLNDPEVTEFTRVEVGEVTQESAERRAAGRTDPVWMIEVDGRPIGCCDLRLEAARQQAGFGIVIGEKEYWGRGYGAAALREVLRRGFGEMHLHRIDLTVFAQNHRGLRCYRKCGFRCEGLHRQAVWKRGRWVDVVSMAILRSEWEALIRPPDGVGEFTLAEYDQLAALWQAAGLSPRASDTKEEVAKKLRRDPDLFLVARREGRIVGSVIGGWDGRRGWVYRMAVHPECRREGVGSALLRELEVRLQRKGALTIRLVYDLNNTAAEAFYRSLGYQPNPACGLMHKPCGKGET